jgi:hypothetical protein
MSDLAVRACDELADRHEALRAEVARIAADAEDTAGQLERETPLAAGVERLVYTLRVTARGLRAALGEDGAR